MLTDMAGAAARALPSGSRQLQPTSGFGAALVNAAGGLQPQVGIPDPSSPAGQRNAAAQPIAAGMSTGAPGGGGATSYQPSANFGSLAQGFGGHLANPTWDPSFDWRLNQGMTALGKSAAVRGNLLTGTTLKDMMNYAQGLASTEYGNAWDRSYKQWMGEHNIFDSNRNFQFGSLATLGNMGLNAANSYMGYLGQAAGTGANAQAAAAAGRGAGWGNAIDQIGNFGASAWLWGNRPQSGGSGGGGGGLTDAELRGEGGY